MPLFGGQYYLELRRLAHRAIFDAGQRLTRPALFERMWAEHSKKSPVATLDKKAMKEEEEKIRRVIENLEFKLPYIRPSRELVVFQKVYRRIEATPEIEYLAERFADELAALQLLLKVGSRKGFSNADMANGEAVFERLRKKGYTFLLKPRPRLMKHRISSHSVNGDGLPRNYVTSHFEGNRRKH